MPYLSINEPAGYIDVYCDGYIISFDTGSNAYFGFIRFYDPTKTTEYFRFYSPDMYSGSSYYLGVDENRTYEILENTPTKVVIRCVGRPDATIGAGTSYLSTIDKYTCIFTIYPDKFTWQHIIEWNAADTGTWRFTTIDDRTITNTGQIHESSENESIEGGTQAATETDYVGVTSNEMNIITTYLDYDGTSFGIPEYTDIALNWEINNDNDPVGAEIWNVVLIFIIDSADREHGSKLYNSTDRLAMGDQYKDFEI